jgi:hypothetical protein
MADDTKLYINCMEEARLRVNFVKELPARNGSTSFQAIDQELVFLQLRKILELIAFASLTANKAKYNAAYKKLTTVWNAKELLRNLEKINPEFYPLPVQHPQVQPDGTKHCAAVDEFLTKDDFVSLYDVASTFLHVGNPFSTAKPVITMRYNVRQWLERIQALLKLHVVRLVDGNLWIVQIPEQGPVKMWLAEPRQVTEP